MKPPPYISSISALFCSHTNSLIILNSENFRQKSSLAPFSKHSHSKCNTQRSWQPPLLLQQPGKNSQHLSTKPITSCSTYLPSSANPLAAPQAAATPCTTTLLYAFLDLSPTTTFYAATSTATNFVDCDGCDLISRDIDGHGPVCGRTSAWQLIEEKTDVVFGTGSPYHRDRIRR